MGIVNLLLAPIKWLWRLIYKPKNSQADDGTAAAPKGPEPARIALLGHTFTGKTVFYGMLYRAFRNDELQLIATSADTASYLQTVVNLLVGLEEYTDATGRSQTRPVDPKFPEGTQDWRAMHFNVRTGGTQFPLEMREYQGEFLALQSLEYLDPDIRNFLDKADCVFFMVDPEQLNNEVAMESRIQSLSILLQRIAGTRERANLPLALLISKADTRPGFYREDQSVLIPPTVMVTRRTTFERLKAAVLKSPGVQKDPVWARSVTEVLDGCSSLLRVALHHADRLQIFFVSSVGKPGRRIDEHGMPRDVPPKPIQSIGLKKPFIWWAEQMLLRRRERRSRRFAKVAAILSLILILVGAGWHFPHRWNYYDARNHWRGPASNCEVATRYFQGFLPYWPHAVFNSRVASRLGWDMKNWKCEENCAIWAARELDNLQCQINLLFNCDDVLTRCFNPVVSRLQRKAVGSETAPPTAGAATAAEPGVVSSETSLDVRLESEYKKCGTDLMSEMTTRIQNSNAGQDLGDLNNKFPFQVGGISDNYGDDHDVSQIQDTLRKMVSCAAGDQDNLGRIIKNPAAAGRIFRLSELLKDSLGECTPKESLRSAKAVREQFQGQAGYLRLASWLESRSIHCLQTVSCANLGLAPETAVQLCLTAINDYLNAGPSTEYGQPALALQQRAYSRIQAIQQQAPGNGASGGHAAPTLPGDGQAPGTEANAPPTPGSPQAMVKLRHASSSWDSLKLVYKEKTATGPDDTDLIYFRLGDAEWSLNYVSDPGQAICVPKDVALSLALGSFSAALSPRSPLTVTWSELVQNLIRQGQPGQAGEPDSADGVGISFDSGLVTATFRVEGQTHGCQQ